MDNAISTLVGEELERNVKWRGTVAGVNNGSLYGIPEGAGVVKFNSLDKSIIYRSSLKTEKTILIHLPAKAQKKG